MSLRRLAVFGVVALGAASCATSKGSEAPAAAKEDPSAMHRAGWVKALATGENCVPEANYKGVCVAASAFGEAKRTSLTQPLRLWGMTFRERYKGADLRQQNINLAALELTPTPDGGVMATLFEQWPQSESDIDYLGSATEQLDNHFFRAEGEPPGSGMQDRLRAGLKQDEGTRRANLQPTAHGYFGETTGIEVRAFPQGWMVATEELDDDGEETRVLGVFVPWPEQE
ncbi:hypothetical protein NR798_00365 [Archangium gephyra]|uniref:hypothetical protein n=1 Tax=Archangium gephyra TaxID=48 RepID=UPI0035D4D165